MSDADLDLHVVSSHHAFPLTSLCLHKIPFHHRLLMSLDKLMVYSHISTERPELPLSVLGGQLIGSFVPTGNIHDI